jgi:hypothetical protein
MKAQILKLLRQRFAKQNKAIPQGLDSVELEKRAEKIAASLEKAKYDGPIDANLINLIEAERTKIKSLSDADLNTMATKLGLNDPSKNRFLQKDNVFDMEGNKIPDGATIMGGKELKETVEQASKRGSPEGVFKAMQNNPEYADIMKDFALSKKFPFSRETNVRSGEDAIPLARAAKFDEEMNKLNISATPGKDADNTVGEFVDQMKKFNVADKDIQMMLGSGKSGQVPYVMEQYGMSASDVVDTLKRGDPLIEGMAQGGRIGFKDGPNMGRRNFLKIMGGLAAIPIVGKFFKVAKAGKTVTKVPVIKTADVAGKPEWFDALVNKVILEGDDVTKKFATQERQVVHSKDLGDGTTVRVTQDTDQGAVRVEYDSDANVFEDTVQMEYKKPLPDEDMPTGGTPEFTTAESGPVGKRYGPDDYEIEIDEVGGSSISDLDSDVSKLKEYATGKGPNMREIIQNKKRKDKAKAITNDPEAQSDAVIKRQGEAQDSDYETLGTGDDYAKGGLAYMLGE